MTTSNYFAAGHRIRIEVSSSNFPRFDRNLNTGGNNYDESQGVVAGLGGGGGARGSRGKMNSTLRSIHSQEKLSRTFSTLSQSKQIGHKACLFS